MDEKVLNIDAVGNSVWLVKVPAFVANILDEASHNQSIGSLNIVGKEISVQLKSQDKTIYNFSMDEIPSSDQQLISFNYNESDDRYIIQGQVTKNSRLRPKKTTEYQQNVIQRSVKATTRPETKLTTIEAAEAEKNISHDVDFIPPAYLDLKRKNTETSTVSGKTAKITYVDTEKLRNKFFEAFSMNPLQSMKDLSIFCQELEGGKSKDRELKVLLDTYSKYHNEGSNRGFYELKNDYKIRTGINNTSTSSSSSSSSSTIN